MSCQIFPLLNDEFLSNMKSQAEAIFYRACRDQFPSNFLVFHSMSVIDQNSFGGHSVGECDFVICDPNAGVLIVEVKGGGIEHKPAEDEAWYSINRNGKKYKIKNPFKQSENYRHRIISIIKEKTKGLKNIMFPTGHSVAFPDISKNSLGSILSHNRNANIIACSEDIEDLNSWYKKSVNFWNGKISNFQPLGKIMIEEIKKVILKPVFVKPSLDVFLNNEEKERIKLTDDQLRLINFLENFDKANIIGGAGTGKTVIAKHLATKFASENKKTLLLCFNRFLGDELSSSLNEIENLTVGSFHSVFQNFFKENFSDYLSSAQNDLPNEDMWKTIRPFAYTLGLEKNNSLKFDAIIVDEAQDLSPDSWMPIEALLKSPSSNFFTLSDTNQSLFANINNIPKLSKPFLLNTNCRNTKNIHEIAYKYYEGPSINPPVIKGQNINFIDALSTEDQLNSILKITNDLINQENINLSKIVILIANSSSYKYYFNLLSNSKKSNFHTNSFNVQNSILVSTIKMFKGLESDILIIWGLNDLPKSEIKQLNYIGISRAKSICYLIN